MVYTVILSAEDGHVMRIVASKPLSSTHARLVTDYLSTDGHCMELYYMIKGTSMVQVKVRGEDFIEYQLGTSVTEVNTLPSC